MIRELKNLSQVIIKTYDLKPIDIEFKYIQRGRASYRTRKITMPIWIFSRAKAYQYYYMIHEITHFIGYEKFNSNGHGDIFKGIESRILNKYNIIPIYSKAYVKELRNLNGEILYRRRK